MTLIQVLVIFCREAARTIIRAALLLASSTRLSFSILIPTRIGIQLLLTLHNAKKMSLKIARINVFQVDLPYSGGICHLSRGREYTSFDATIVRITTQNGIEGWGESTPFGSTYIASHALGVRAGIAETAPQLIGLDPRMVDRINDTMEAALLGHEHAKTVIDIACWDIFGKSVGLPVCQLLGGRTDVKLPVLDSIPVADAEGMRKLVADSRAAGHTGFSVKIGEDPVANTVLITTALADRQPDEFFLVDANGGLTVETALRMLRLLPNGFDFVLEAPCATYRGSVSLRRRTNVPIISTSSHRPKSRNLLPTTR